MSTTTPTTEPLAVIAVVQFNKGEALVLNRNLQFTYREDGKNFIGSDGPFRDFLYYSSEKGAFAGREFTLFIEDGTERKIKDNWWDSCPKEYRSVTACGLPNLKACYVFCGAYMLPEDFETFRATYTGCVYPYWDYEKVVKFDDERRANWNRIQYLERKNAKLKAHFESTGKQTALIQGAVDAAFEEANAYADGAPDASAHDKLANQISGILHPFATKKKPAQS